ncbi:MAG: HD domain-containing protein [Candidatus Paceibacterota bacterium]
MTQNLVIKAAEKFVKKALDGEGTGHDWWHIERVRNNAKLICKTEKADKFIVDLTLLLHDVGDRKVIHAKEDDYSIAENFLKKQKVPANTIDEIMFIIKNMSFSKSLNTKRDSAPMEFYIVQDADRLDAVGAIGIARAFAYGGSKGRPLYDPTKKAQNIKTTKGYQALNSSSLHHFEEKLFLLKNLMNTRTAKKIAADRHAYMKNYVKQFLLEWEGKR